jgi:hypothetical protein
MKLFLLVVIFLIELDAFGQEKFLLEVRPIDSRVTYINNRNISSIEVVNLLNNKKEALKYYSSHDTVEVFRYSAKLKTGRYLLRYKNYFEETVTERFEVKDKKKHLLIYPDRLLSKKVDFLKPLIKDTIYIRNEFQSTKHISTYNFTITKQDGQIYLTTYEERSYFPDTTVDKSTTLNGTAFIFDKPAKSLRLDHMQQQLVNNFLNELLHIKSGGNWSSADAYLHNLNKTWISVTDKHNYWLGGQILLRQLKMTDE